MTYISTFSVLLIIFLGLRVSFAQEVSDFSVTNYNSDNGLPQNSVMKIEVDRAGYMWLATQAGLVRFDGTHFEVYDQHNTRSIKNNRIIDLDLISDSTIFCENSAFNVLTFDENNAEYLFDFTIRNQAVVMLSRQQRFNVIDSLYVKDQKLVKSFLHPVWATDVLYNQIGQLGDGFLRVGDDYVFYLEQRRIRMYKKLGQERKSVVGINRSGVLGKNFYYFDNPTSISRLGYDGKESRVSHLSLPGKNTITLLKGQISLFQQGKQLFLLNQGVIYRLKEGAENELICEPILETGNVPEIMCYRYVPKLGIHVVGTFTKGMFIFKEKQFKTVIVPSKSSNFYSQFIYKNNGVITEQGIIFPNHTYTGYPFPLSPRSGIFQDRQKNLWMTDRNRMTVVMDQNLRVLKRIDLGNSLSDVDQDSDGAFWLSSLSSNFGKLVGDSVQWLNARGEMPDALSAMPFGRNQLWVTNGGSHYVFNTKTNSVSEQVMMDSTDIRVLYQDRKNVRWIGTYGRGFYAHWKGKSQILPLDRNGYLLYTHSFREDNKGFLWMSTNHGLFKCKIQDLYDYLEGRSKTIYYYYYDKSNGFNTNEFNGGCSPSSVAFPDGKFSYPSMDGLVQFYPDRVRDILPLSDILIDKFITDGQERPFSEELALEPSLNRIEIKIASPYFGTPENQMLEYNVQGLDDEWYAIGAAGTITLNRLAYGDYSLQVRKRTGFGKDNVALLIKKFMIKPFWYQTWYFRVFMVLLAATFFFALVRLRYFYLVNRKKQLEILVKQRTNQLEYSNKLKDKIAMLLAHDLQSPLHFLNVLSEYVAASVDKREYQEVKTGINEIRKAAGKAHAFISDINLWTKSQQESFYFTKKPFSFFELIAELEFFFTEMLLVQNNTLEMQGEECALFTNREILKAVIRNLIDNSNKYTHGGKIFVSLEKEPDDTLTLTVSDNGGGMSPADLRRINRRIENVMTSEGIEYGGRLGYQIIIDFVTRLECKLTLQSTKGQGTIVKISGLSMTTQDQKYSLYPKYSNT